MIVRNKSRGGLPIAHVGLDAAARPYSLGTFCRLRKRSVIDRGITVAVGWAPAYTSDTKADTEQHLHMMRGLRNTARHIPAT